MDIEGFCDPAFLQVREVFESHFARGWEMGAGLTVYAADRLVVDLWGGVADSSTGRRWARDTTCPAVSCAKAVTATAALLLADRGAYDLEAPVTGFWPEYGTHGKEETTAAHLLSHQAGLPAFQRFVRPEEAADGAAIAAELAAQAPEWTPGEAHGYHVVTFGFLIGEIVRRLSGRPVGDFIRAEFAKGTDLWLGAPPDVIERAAKMVMPSGDVPLGTPPEPGELTKDYDPEQLAKLAESVFRPDSVLIRALFNLTPRAEEGFNDPLVLAAGWPSVGMLTSAPALAGFYRDLVAGRILRPATVREATRMRVRGPDRVILVDSAFGLGFTPAAMAFMRALPVADSAFGHAGAGGSIGLGDLDAGLSMAYLPNLMGHHFAGDERAFNLVEAVYASLV